MIEYGGIYRTKMELNKFISNRVMHYIVPCGDIPSKTRNFSVDRYTILPYAAISCLVLPNCHQCAAIECKSSHKIVPYADVSPSVCYIVSGVPRYANNHATISSPMLLYRMQ